MQRNSTLPTQQIPKIRATYPGETTQPTELESVDYISYFRGFLILGVFILTALVALAVIQFWGASQTAHMNQLQTCMARINPDANTNYQLETYKCMNAS